MLRSLYQRTMLTELLPLARQYPVIGLMGPRQSGKTTLVRMAFPERVYANLEVPDVRLAAQTDPVGFLAQFPDGTILDKIQRVPELVSYVQARVDKDKIPGLFIITGSYQLELHQAVSQSLAGRVGLLNLYPLTQNELAKSGFKLDLDDKLYHGFYPEIYHGNLNPTQAYRFYIQTYLEKDVRAISAIHNLLQFQNFMKLCAGRIGQLLDYLALSNDVGVSANTIKNWFSVLEASHMTIRLKPYYENFGKRVIKSQKLYFTDVGLAAYLLDIENKTQVSRDPLRGQLIENLVIMELYKYRHNLGLNPNLYFFRDSQQKEIDVIIKQGNQLIPIEIKASATFTPSFLKHLHYFRELITLERVPNSYLVYTGDMTQTVSGVQLLNYQDTSRIYEQTPL